MEDKECTTCKGNGCLICGYSGMELTSEEKCNKVATSEGDKNGKG